MLGKYFSSILLEEIDVRLSPMRLCMSCRKFLAKVFRQSCDEGSLPRYILRNFASSYSIAQLTHLLAIFLRDVERGDVGACGHRFTNDNINYTALSHAR